MKESAIKLTLPLPPSVNECYTGYPKRVKSETYKNWLEWAGLKFRVHGYQISGSEWLEAIVVVYTPLFCKNGNKKIQDLDNFLKPIFDCLGTNIPGFKDEHIKIIKASKHDSKLNEVEITIKELQK